MDRIAMPTGIDLTDLTIVRGRKVLLEGCNLTLQPGMTLLTGGSGTGKSSLLRVLATADKPTGGTVSFADSPIRSRKKLFRKVLGYAPQSVDLPEELTGHEFVMHMAALKELNRSDVATQVAAIAEHLNLQPDMQRRISAFSGGMRRRLILMQALLGDPRVLLLDEPTAELDEALIERTVSLLATYVDSAVIVVATHLPTAFAALGPQTLRIEAGRATFQ